MWYDFIKIAFLDFGQFVISIRLLFRVLVRVKFCWLLSMKYGSNYLFNKLNKACYLIFFSFSLIRIILFRINELANYVCDVGIFCRIQQCFRYWIFIRDVNLRIAIKGRMNGYYSGTIYNISYNVSSMNFQPFPFEFDYHIQLWIGHCICIFI